MPLSFESTSHGAVAFGFFNIDSDMLLLEHYFFFAREFCGYISEAAKGGAQGRFESTWKVYAIEDPGEIGDLMGAIHGIRYTGFIGDVYRRFPFPSDPANFKQDAEGFRNREVVEEIIRPYAVPESIRFHVQEDGRDVEIGMFSFSRQWFQKLINYVWVGGYPRWRYGKRPDYVMEMKASAERSRHPVFIGLSLDE